MSLEDLLGGFDPQITVLLLGTSFVASFITVAIGIGGGSLLLAMLASFMPPAALIPVHGVIQLGSGALRAAVLLRSTYWAPLAAFTLGSAIGAAFGGMVLVNLPPEFVLIGVGLFVIYNVLSRPPAWLSRMPLLTGLISSFLTMFFGATGVFVANFTKSLSLTRESHVATHAVLMTLQHGLKIVVFGLLGFAYGPWIGFIIAMIAAGFLGTLAGRSVLIRLSDQVFKRALDIVLILISLRLIWQGVSSLLA